MERTESSTNSWSIQHGEQHLNLDSFEVELSQTQRSAELIDQNAESCRPERLLQRNVHSAAC